MTGVTIADAPLPDFGTDENAKPNRVHVVSPRTLSHTSAAHFSGLLGSSTSKRTTPMAMSSTSWIT